ncbi:MAG: ABC transporter transmembrane domain-containing protein, partial [Saezia sp.]
MDFSSFDFKRFFKYVIPHQIGLWVTFACSVIGASIETIIPATLKPLLDSIVGANTAPDQPPPAPSIIETYWWIIPLGISGVFILRALINYIASYAMIWSTSRIILSVRNDLFRHIL